MKSGAVQQARRLALGVGQPRHHDQGHHSETDPDDAGLRSFTPGQGLDGIEGDVGREQEETEADQPQGPPLDPLRVLASMLCVQSP